MKIVAGLKLPSSRATFSGPLGTVTLAALLACLWMIDCMKIYDLLPPETVAMLPLMVFVPYFGEIVIVCSTSLGVLNHRFRHPSLTLSTMAPVLANVLALAMLWIYAALDVGLQPMLDMGASGLAFIAISNPVPDTLIALGLCAIIGLIFGMMLRLRETGLVKPVEV